MIQFLDESLIKSVDHKFHKKRNTQVQHIASEAVYKRTNQKTQDLKIDQFFYREQLRLFS